MEYGYLRNGIFNFTYEEFQNLPMKKLNRYAGFMQGVEEKTRQDAERRKWKNGG